MINIESNGGFVIKTGYLIKKTDDQIYVSLIKQNDDFNFKNNDSIFVSYPEIDILKTMKTNDKVKVVYKVIKPNQNKLICIEKLIK